MKNVINLVVNDVDFNVYIDVTHYVQTGIFNVQVQTMHTADGEDEIDPYHACIQGVSEMFDFEGSIDDLKHHILLRCDLLSSEYKKEIEVFNHIECAFAELGEPTFIDNRKEE